MIRFPRIQIFFGNDEFKIVLVLVGRVVLPDLVDGCGFAA
jgi:hypothetical protein